MREIRNIIRPAILPALLVACFLSACAHRSPEPRLYVFAPHEGWRVVAQRGAEESDLIIRIAPVHIPAYLDRPHMVTRVSDHEIETHNFHRWGMPLDVTIQELLAGAIGRSLPEAYVDASPRLEWMGEGYWVQVDIIRLDGVLDGRVELIAQWKVTRTGDQPQAIAQRTSLHQAESESASYEEYVEAICKVVLALGAEIAGVLERP